MANGRKAKRTQKRKSVIQNRDEKKKRGHPQTNPNSLANLQHFKSKAELGGQLDSRINVGGRPKLLGEAHRKVLASKYPDALIELSGLLQAQIRTYAPNESITYADAIALDVAKRAATGDVSAAREMRSATEGERLNVRTWRDDIVEMLKARQITPEQVRKDFEDDADSLIAAAGLLGSGEGA